MEEDFYRIAFKKGRRFLSSNNAPFQIDDPESIWIVENGSVDLFFVETDDDKPLGRRHHLFRIETRQALFGVALAQAHMGFQLLAVGTPGTIVHQLSLNELKKLLYNGESTEVIVSLVESWIRQFSNSLTFNIYPRPVIDVFLEKTQELAITSRCTLTAQKGVVWLAKVPQDALFIGLEFISAKGQLFFPLTRDTWLQSGSEMHISVYNTPEIIKQRDFWPSLQLFHQLFITCHCTNVRLDIVDEINKIQETHQYHDEMLQTAFRDLSQTIRRKKKLFTDREGLALIQDPLVKACMLVAHAEGFDLQMPPDFHSTEYKDPVNSLFLMLRVPNRQINLSGDWWKSDSGPVLGFLTEGDKPVALIPTAPGRYLLIDPDDESEKPVDAATTATLQDTGFVIYRPLPNEPITFKKLLRFGFLGSSRDITFIVLLAIAGTLLGFLVPVFTGEIVATVIPEAARDQLFQMIFALIIAALVTFIFQLTRSIALLRIQSRYDIKLQAGLIDRLFKLPVAFFRNFTAGEITMRAYGLNIINQLIGGTTATMILTGIFVFLNFGLLFYYNTDLSWWALGIVVIAFLCLLVFAKFQLKYQRAVQELTQKIQGKVYQFLAGIAKLRSTGSEESAFAIWANYFSRLRFTQYSARNLQIFVNALFYIFPLVAAMIIYYKVNALMAEKPMAISDFISFTAAFATITNTMNSFSMISQQIVAVIPIYENMRPLFTTPPEVDERKTIVEKLTGNVEINHVSYQYRPDAPLVLKDITIHINRGEFVAFVGPSGAGKSTLLRLLLGFEQPLSGTIYYDGQDLAGLDVASLRQHIGTVLQSSRLQTGSILKNILGTSTDLTIEDAWDAARLVGIEEDIRQMPMGMHTLISERGATYSGGQRQRLLLARALVKKNPILLLDEATSALDNKTQEVVSKSLDEINMTRIVIAHRLSTIQNANCIYVIQNGMVVETGTFQELLQKNGVFTEMAKRQMV